MKRILITGANSYIGTSFEKYLQQWPEDYAVDTVDMIDGSWRKKSFSGYDTVFHVAGIAHIKETKENSHLYYAINRDMAIEAAHKAKNEGVEQFVFLSTMAVYGMDEGAITIDTLPMPKTNYGISKMQAEEKISAMADERFSIVILRPPMVYGDGCKGNYQALVKIANIAPFFADYKNKRSMIHIDKLCQYVKNIIEESTSGIILPQDENYVCTCSMIQDIAKKHGKNLKLYKFLNPAVLMLKCCTGAGKKAFGNLYYKK